jgi:hypothetical protein
MDFVGGPFSLPNNSLGLAAATIQVDAAIDAKNIAVAAGSLNVSSTGGLHAGNSLVAVVSGNANITGGYMKSTSGDLEMLVGRDLTISDGGYIWAGYTQMSPPFADASIAVGGNLTLSNGASINAANDVFIDMLGLDSTISLNGGGLGPSYILSDIGTGLAATTHVTFLNRNAGGILIDGEETTKTVVGGSGFFAVDSSTPALVGAGLDITYASQAGGSVAQQLADTINRAAENASTTDTPTDDGGPKVNKKDKKDKDKDDAFGSDEGDGKKDEKPGQRKVAQCT